MSVDIVDGKLVETTDLELLERVPVYRLPNGEEVAVETYRLPGRARFFVKSTGHLATNEFRSRQEAASAAEFLVSGLRQRSLFPAA